MQNKIWCTSISYTCNFMMNAGDDDYVNVHIILILIKRWNNVFTHAVINGLPESDNVIGSNLPQK